MVIFSTNIVNLKGAKSACISRSRGDQPLLAVALSPSAGAGSNYAVALLAASGETPKPGEEKLIRNVRGKDAAQLAWNPVRRILAIAWNCGAISLWDGEMDTIRPTALSERTNKHVDKFPVTILQWCGDGKHFVSGDRAGVAILWAMDENKKPIILWEYREQGAQVVGACFGPVPPDSDVKLPEGAVKSPSLFFVLSFPSQNKYKVMYQSGMPNEPPHVMHTSDSMPVHLTWYASKSQLVMVTLDGQLSLMEPGGKGHEWKTARSLKLASIIAGGNPQLYTAWLEPGTLAIASDKDHLVRLYNLDADDNTTLPIPSLQSDAAAAPGAAPGTRQAHLTSLTYHEGSKSIAIGTGDGMLVVYRRSVVKRDNEEAPGWDLISQHDVSKEVKLTAAQDTGACAITALSVGPKGEEIVATTPSTLVVIRSTPVLHKSRLGVAAIQLSANEVSVHALVPSDLTIPGELSAPLTEAGVVVRCYEPLEGMDLTRQHVLVWGKKRCDIYEIKGQEAQFVATSPGLSQGEITGLALNKEFLFRGIQNRLEICTFAGAVKQSFPVEEGQGRPAVLDCNGDTLVAISNKMFLRAYRVVSGGAAKSFGPPSGRRLELQGNQVQSVLQARVNRDGSKVAFLAIFEQPVPDLNEAREAAAAAASAIPMDRTGSFNLRGASSAALLASSAATRGSLQATASFRGSTGASGTPLDQANKPAPKGPSQPVLCVYDLGADVLHTMNPKGTVINFCWDEDFVNLLGVQIEKPALDAAVPPPRVVQTFFCSSDHGILSQDDQEVAADLTLSGIRVPFIYCFTERKKSDLDPKQTIDNPAGDGAEGRDATPPPSDENAVQMISAPEAGGAGRSRAGASASTLVLSVVSVLMRSFMGMESSGQDLRQALLAFNYFLAIGQVDEAYRAVRNLDDPKVWAGMALMSIRTKRLDIAEHCLGHLGNVRAARAVQDVKSIKELDARVAMVAVQLGLLDEARRLLEGCERYDLLNKVLQAQGDWVGALEIAETKDRIHLKSTHYRFAKWLEECDQLQDAILHYEQSGTSKREVPRMLYQRGAIGDLQQYIISKNEKDLYRWWAHLAESEGNFREALDAYDKAGDLLSMVKILCFENDIDAARHLVEASDDPAAAFQLAMQLELRGNPVLAVQYYERAKRFNQAARVAKSNSMSDQVFLVAQKAGQPRVLSEAARYFEEIGDLERAVILYKKAGLQGKALDLCFSARLFDALQSIADELDMSSDPSLLSKCATFFLENGELAKAVKLMVMAKDIEAALAICEQQDLILTEELAEKMIPDKDAVDKATRDNVLRRVAKVAKGQGNYALAAKMYTQSGDRKKAMKALMRTGDAKKVIFFAGVTRDPEMYRMAANYLQSLDWHSDPEVTKNIILFYNKAKDFRALASFYESCAQQEIDEYRDYEKALQAMKEAATWLERWDHPSRDLTLSSLRERVSVCEKFVGARRLLDSAPADAERILVQLLSEVPDEVQPSEAMIRLGDVFALLIGMKYNHGSLEMAFQLLQRMQARGLDWGPYLEAKMVADIFRANGLEPAGNQNAQASPGFNRGTYQDSLDRAQGSSRFDQFIGEDDIAEEVEDDF